MLSAAAADTHSTESAAANPHVLIFTSCSYVHASLLQPLLLLPMALLWMQLTPRLLLLLLPGELPPASAIAAISSCFSLCRLPYAAAAAAAAAKSNSYPQQHLLSPCSKSHARLKLNFPDNHQAKLLCVWSVRPSSPWRLPHLKCLLCYVMPIAKITKELVPIV